MKTKIVLYYLLLAFVIMLPIKSWSHCEIPCGIYDDQARVNLISEHITTIEKSMNQITALSAEGEKNYNQLVRWINNKEEHADKLMEIVTQYFMTQRLKPVEQGQTKEYKAYFTQLTLLHEMLVSAMKCKQTTDLAHTEKLKELLEKFKESYFGKEGHFDKSLLKKQ